MITTALGVAVATCALAGAPAPGHGIYSDISTGVPLTNRNLLVQKPYPNNRTSTTTYTNGGRLWAPATAQDKILSSLYPGGGPVVMGAPLDQANEVFFVRPQSEPWPDVALSPYQTINHDTIRDIVRRRPWLVRSPERTDRLVEELRAAQRRFLRQQGYVAKVRTHINAAALRGGVEDGGTETGSVEPSATMRLRPVTPAPKQEEQLRTSLPNADEITRISLPGQTPESQIVVVREQTTETAEAEDDSQG